MEFDYYECMSTELENEYRKRLNKIPKINFDKDMDVVLRPPFSNALVRMQVNGYSIYLDVRGSLGYYDGPYREIYDGEEYHRFDMGDTKGLVDKIRSLPKE